MWNDEETAAMLQELEQLKKEKQALQKESQETRTPSSKDVCDLKGFEFF